MTEGYEFNIDLVGAENVGKTAFIQRQLTDEFNEEYKPSLSKNMKKLFFNTSEGRVVLNVTNHPGGKVQREMRGEGVIVMFDLTNKRSFREAMLFAHIIENVAIFCGNKSDCTRVVKKGDISTLSRVFPYYNISVKNEVNHDYIFLRMIRLLLCDDNIVFT